MKMRISPELPKQQCSHPPDLIWGMCPLCDQTFPVPKPIGKQPRLSLVLDLDHTLLNTTPLSKMPQSEADYLAPLVDFPNLLEQENPSGALFMLQATESMTKLRPFVRTFLEEASRLFDLYIFTMGAWYYASDMVYLLDPNETYIGRDRVFTREDAILNDKSLGVVPVEKSACLIIDDLSSVWPDDKDNLIQIDKYNYFASSCTNRGVKSWSELETDESEAGGSLARVLGLLRRVHEEYFEGGGSDVRDILRDIRKDILGGCRVKFSRSCVRGLCKWQAAALGAVREAQLGPTVTHVVAEDPESDEAAWAAKEGKFLVSPRWIEAAYYSWERPSESLYILKY